MRELRIFKLYWLTLAILVLLMFVHALYKANTTVKNPSLIIGITKLNGNPYQNNSIYFRHFEYADYFSGHFYYPSSPILANEAFIYKGTSK